MELKAQVRPGLVSTSKVECPLKGRFATYSRARCISGVYFLAIAGKRTCRATRDRVRGTNLHISVLVRLLDQPTRDSPKP